MDGRLRNVAWNRRIKYHKFPAPSRLLFQVAIDCSGSVWARLVSHPDRSCPISSTPRHAFNFGRRHPGFGATEQRRNGLAREIFHKRAATGKCPTSASLSLCTTEPVNHMPLTNAWLLSNFAFQLSLRSIIPWTRNGRIQGGRNHEHEFCTVAVSLQRALSFLVRCLYNNRGPFFIVGNCIGIGLHN